VVKYVDAAEVRTVVAAVLAAAADAGSSHTTSQNLALIWLSQGL
jgi:hypothetical protein